ncbi:signal transduction histidine kinase [Aestuariispira insulae]|uniref:histidine kinase n=1 Tax=Aestuariispira insulae TaxID=1461337 RepID=A0A3D9HPH5_9PROT|nr:signal transduction histidine kinase [Aestuariispira insulae]
MALALAYFAAGYFGLQFPYFGSTVTLIWPPSGIALAALYCWGIRAWPGVALGAFAVNMTTGVPLETVILITIGNSLAAIIGAWVLRRLIDENPLEKLRSLMIFLSLGVVASPLISSLNGAAVVSATLIGNWDGYFSIWWGWWVGDLIGVLLFAPLLILLSEGKGWNRSIVWYAELFFMIAGAVAISVIVHLSDILARQEFLFIFVSLPFALWGALRFGMLGVALANIAVSISAILFLANGLSFFIQGDQQGSLIRFYGYFSLMGVAGLFLATLTEKILDRDSDENEGVSKRVRQVRVMLALGAGALGLSLSIAAATISHDQITKTDKLELHQYQLIVENSLRLHMDQSLVPVYAVKTLFEAQPDVPREMFREMTSPWIDRSPAIQALEWVPVVSADQRAFYEALARESGFPDFQFKEWRDGDLVVAAERKEYRPVYFVVPEKGNEEVVGFDLNSHPARRVAMENALARRGLSMTEPIELIQDTEGIDGILIYLPVWAEEQQTLLGYALGVYRLSTLLETVFHAANLPSGIGFHLVDYNAPVEKRLLFSTDPFDFLSNHKPGMADSQNQVHHQFYLGGRNWTIILESRGPAHGLSWDWQPYAILVIGTILSGSLSFYLLSLTRTEDRIAGLVKERTKMLRAAQLDAETALEQAQQASQAKSEFLAHMSHELRSPLNSILGYAELALKDKETPLKGQVNNYLQTIVSSGKHLAALIGDILDLSKVEAGQLSLESVAFDMRALLAELNSIVSLQARERGNRLEVKIDPRLAQWTEGDPVRIRQILMNLLTNATKFTQKGTILLEVIVLEDEDSVQKLRFCVVDSGIGISRDKQESIFGAFTQADMSTTRQYGGTGLGLAINKFLVEAMDGRIGVESELGVGSSFWFEIQLPKAEALQPNQNNSIEIKPMDAPILVVEDIEINRVMTAKRLEAAGYSIEEACDGKQAVEMASIKRYGAILMDIHMPVMDGIEATRQIRAFQDPDLQSVPIVALTADAASSNVRQYLAVGMNDFCAKPLNMDHLLQVLGQLGTPAELSAEPNRHLVSATLNDGLPEGGEKALDRVVDETRYFSVKEALPDCEDLFIQQTDGIIDTFKDLADREEREALRKEAHALKGVAMNLGFDQLRKICAELESHMKGDVDQHVLSDQISELSAKLDGTLQAIDEIRNRET